MLLADKQNTGCCWRACQLGRNSRGWQPCTAPQLAIGAAQEPAHNFTKGQQAPVLLQQHRADAVSAQQCRLLVQTHDAQEQIAQCQRMQSVATQLPQ
jgi:hypothetical protein